MTLYQIKPGVSRFVFILPFCALDLGVHGFGQIGGRELPRQ